MRRLGDELDDTTGSLDLLLSLLGDEAGLDDEGLVDGTLAEELEGVGRAVDEVNDGDGAGRGVDLGLRKSDQLVDVDRGAVVVVAEEVEVTHTNFAKIACR